MTLQEFFTDESKWKQEGGIENPNCLCFWLATEVVEPKLSVYQRHEMFLLPLAKAIWPKGIITHNGKSIKEVSISDIIVWNDAPERTFADIRRVIEEANV